MKEFLPYWLGAVKSYFHFHLIEDGAENPDPEVDVSEINSILRHFGYFGPISTFPPKGVTTHNSPDLADSPVHAIIVASRPSDTAVVAAHRSMRRRPAATRMEIHETRYSP
jgi:hypothetical protein